MDGRYRSVLYSPFPRMPSFSMIAKNNAGISFTILEMTVNIRVCPIPDR